MSNRIDHFERWYAATLGGLEGHDDPENREAVRKMWNGILEHAARQFEFELFDEMTGDAVADRLRRMQAIAS